VRQKYPGERSREGPTWTKAAVDVDERRLDKMIRLGDCSISKAMLDGASSKIEASVAPCDAEAASEKIVRAGHP
jgi:hypothetical protein